MLVIMKMKTSLVNVLTLIIIASKHLFATANKVQFECCDQIRIEDKGQEFDGLYKLDRTEDKWMEYCVGGCIYLKNFVSEFHKNKCLTLCKNVSSASFKSKYYKVERR